MNEQLRPFLEHYQKVKKMRIEIRRTLKMVENAQILKTLVLGFLPLISSFLIIVYLIKFLIGE